MSIIKQLLSLLYNIVTFPFHLLTKIIPGSIDYFIFKYYKARLEVTRKNCWFLINPLSGKKIGKKVIMILKELYPAERVLDITSEEYVK